MSEADEKAALTQRMYAEGFSDIAAFCAYCENFDVAKFEPDPSTGIESGAINCSRAELTAAKRDLLSWLLDRLGNSPYRLFRIRRL